MAVVNSRRSDSGSARVVSSVTYITDKPCFTAKLTASADSRSSLSRVQSSAYWRIGLDPMNVQHSMARPVRCEISTTGVISAMSVRAAQLAATFSFASTISRASRSTSRTT